VVRAAAGIHSHRTGRQIRQRPNQLRAGTLSPNDNPAARIKANEVKAVLADVNADRATCMDEILLSRDHHLALVRTGGGPSH
jgi:hypothetical protein